MRLFHRKPKLDRITLDAADVAALRTYNVSCTREIETLGALAAYLACEVERLQARDREWSGLAGQLCRENTAAEARVEQLAGVTVGLPYPLLPGPVIEPRQIGAPE
jgi:hypothetical protein